MADKTVQFESPLLAPHDSAGAGPEPARLWSDRGLIITVSDGSEARTVRFPAPYARIGSLPECDIVVKGEGVPPRAFYLHATDQGIFCIALDEAPELFHGWIKPGQRLLLGRSAITAELDGGDLTTGTPAEALDAKSLPDDIQPAIVVSHTGRVLETRKLPRRLTILGRTRPSTVRVRDPGLSGCHCALYWTEAGMWVIDLASTTGTLQDGSALGVACLSAGSSFEAGNLQISLRGPGHLEAAHRSAGRSAQLLTLRQVAADHGQREEETLLKERLARLAAELQQTRAARAESESALQERCQHLNAALADQEAAFAQERNSAEKERRRLESLLLERAQTCRLLQEQLNRAANDHSQELATLREELARQNSRRESEDATSHGEISRLQADLDALRQQLQEQDEAARRAAEDRAGWETERGNLERRIAELSEKLRELPEQHSHDDGANPAQVESLLQERDRHATALAEAREAWDRERQALQQRVAAEESRRQSATAELEQMRHNRQRETQRLLESLREREAALQRENEELRQTKVENQGVAELDRWAWEEERRRLETEIASLQSQHHQAEADQASALKLAEEELSRLRQLSQDREIELEHARKKLQELHEREDAAQRNRIAWEAERGLLDARLAEQESQLADLRIALEASRQQQQEGFAECAHHSSLGAEASSVGTTPSRREDPDALFLALRGESDVHLSELTPQNGEDRRAEVQQKIPHFGMEDPRAMHRMVRFARQKQGRFLPKIRTMAIYALWSGAILVAIAAALFVAGRLPEGWLP